MVQLQLKSVTLPNPTRFLDSDVVFYRNVLRYTEEIDRDMEAAMQFFRDTKVYNRKSVQIPWLELYNLKIKQRDRPSHTVVSSW